MHHNHKLTIWIKKSNKLITIQVIRLLRKIRRKKYYLRLSPLSSIDKDEELEQL
jgi:hypothetical protein